jgi:hypothetical protein
MNPSTRPSDAAPGGMRGATRMHDPSEAAHDRARRRWMNVAFVALLLASAGQWRWVGVHGWDWLGVLVSMIAAIPLGLGVKVFELRFKMSPAERRLVLNEIPARRNVEFVIYSVLATIAFALLPQMLPGSLWGIWLYDFVTYYHDRPERIRHLYAVTKTLDELREFPAPWAWTLPALAWETIRMIARR